MACCTRYCAAETQFGKEKADGDLKSYRRRGAEGITGVMLSELRRWPLQGRQLLDIGSGIGVVSAELAANGVASATLVEASPSYLEVAREVAGTRYSSGSSQFLLADFVAIAPTLPDAEVVTLDRVVCCYPDAEALLQAAAMRTRQLLALTYPRDRWYVRATTATQNLLRRLRGSEFKVFIHPPQRMAATLDRAGLTRVTQRKTLTWVMDLYRRG